VIAKLARPLLSHGAISARLRHGATSARLRHGATSARLRHGATSARLRHDRGAVGVLIGILISGGVLIGLGALVVDVGQIYTERAQLQSGAEAGALAVAKSCAKGACNAGVAGSYANANSSDGVSAVNKVCGSGSLGACPSSTGTI